MAAWVIKAASAALFFNRTSLILLQQIQDRISPQDAYLQQDFNLLAATQFSVDATLTAVNFVSRPLSSSVAARRLVWLRNWQTDTKSKWRLAAAPYSGGSLFGESLEPILVASKDKKNSGWCPTTADQPTTHLNRRLHLRGIISPGWIGRWTGVSPGTVIDTSLSISPNISLRQGGPFEGPAANPSAGGSDSLGNPPIGGHLAIFAETWAAVTSDTWVLSTVCEGLRLKFFSFPPNCFRVFPVSKVREKCKLMRTTIKHLLGYPGNRTGSGGG